MGTEDAGRLLLATQAWVALSSPGSHKILRPPRPRFLCSPNMNGKRTEEPSANVVSSIKTQKTLRLKVFALKSQFLCQSTKRGREIKSAKQKKQQQQQQQLNIKKRKLKLPPLC